MEKKPEEAVALLEKYNQDFPNSPKILIQLSRALVESEQYSLAAFRLDQAISVGGAKELLVECAEAYQLAGDLNSAQERYQQYLSDFPEDEKARLSLARVLAQNGLDTEALNAFEQSIKRANAKDCLLAGNLYLKKKYSAKPSNGLLNLPGLRARPQWIPWWVFCKSNYPQGMKMLQKNLSWQSNNLSQVLSVSYPKIKTWLIS